jgi:broad specificity phosphatase PhoE
MGSMVETLIFETHATSLDNEAGLASGWFDADLSPRGEREALELGLRHAASGVSVVYVSDLWRSWKTAHLAFGDRVPIVRDFRLRECDYGELTRRSQADIERVRAQSVTVPFPGGESYRDVADRVRGCLEELLAENDGTVLVVGHRATHCSLEHLLRGVPLADAVAAPWAWQPGWRYDRPGLA